ncbi:MAG: acyl-CoA dehydrogenase family protein [Rubrivivax sp.]
MTNDAVLTDLQADARAVLGHLRTGFDAGLHALAQACAVQGRLDGRRLDEHQVACYDLAWTSAELLAAQTLMDPLGPAACEADAWLALVFCSDAAAASLERLQLLHLEHGLDPAPLQALAASREWARLRLQAGSGRALAQAGRAVVAAGGDIAQVDPGPAVRMACESFARLGRELVAPLAQDIHRQDLTVPESILQPLREMGVFGLSIPERYGGTRPDDVGDMLMMVAVTEALSEASLGAAGSLITRPEILSRALLAGGTEAQKRHWLPRIAQGDPLCAIAMTEPDHGSDVAGVSLRAERVEGGWRLNGAKTWCTFAGKAGLLMVVARTDPDRSAGYRGLSVLLVEKPSDGGHAFDHTQPGGGRLQGRAIPTIGYRGMHSYDLSFEDFFVPGSCVIGEEAGLGQGFYYTMAGMVGGRLQTAARACGVMWGALRAALTHTAGRKVFGATLDTYALTLAKIARMGARLLACRRLTYAVAGRLDEEGSRIEASLVKLLACRCAEWVTRESLQLHGGMGYAQETPISRLFVDARVLSIFEGAEETLALKVIARGLLEQALAESAHPSRTDRQP